MVSLSLGVAKVLVVWLSIEPVDEREDGNLFAYVVRNAQCNLSLLFVLDEDCCAILSSIHAGAPAT